MEDLKKCNVFISSPGDLKEERTHISKFLEEFKMENVIFNPMRWEKDLPNTSLSSPQPLINKQLLDKADILIGIFAAKFGSKTENADSGTVEEIETFIAKGKPVILYFYDINISTAELTDEKLQNIQKILEFKKKYAEKHIYSMITNIEELTEALKRDITYNFKQILAQASVNRANKSVPKKIVSKKTVANKSSQQSKNPWYMDSIAELINKYLKGKGVSFYYRGNLTFHENLQFLMGTTNYTAFVERQFLESARIDAFNFKYGNYDYSEDLRDRFPQWGKQIYERIYKLSPDFNSKPFRVLNIGGNDGT